MNNKSYELICKLKMRKGWLDEAERNKLQKWEYGPLQTANWLEYSDIPINQYRVIFFFDN